MAHDARVSSRSEHSSSLERQVSDLQAILAHLLACINEAKADVAGNRARIDRCAAMAASAAARAELAVKNAQEAVPVAREAALEELLKVARAANEDDGPRHGPPPKRDRHGMHVVRDMAGGTAALAALFSFLRSPWARGTHRAVSFATMAALGGAATIAGPSLLAPSPSPAHAAAVVPAHHGHHHARWRASMLNVDPPDAPVHHARHRHSVGVVPAASPSGSPGAPGQPAPSPAPTLPVAVPSPTLPVVPPPLPSPSPTACHGKHCHGGDDPGQVLSGLLPRWQH